MRKHLRHTIILAAGLTAGFASGWYGRPVSSPEPGAARAGSHKLSMAAAPPDSAASNSVSGGAGLTACREMLTKEPNHARAAGRVVAMLDRMSPGDISALAQEINNGAGDWSDAQTRTLMELVYGRLAEVDPAKALSIAMSVSDPWSRATSVTPVIEYLARTNPAAAEAALTSLPLGELRSSVTSKLAATMAQTDGPAAVALMERLKIPPREWAWRKLYQSWAAHDPAAASASLATMPRQMALNNMEEVAAAWARRNSTAAMAWAQSLTDPALRSSALEHTIGTIAQKDPAQATALASAQPVHERRGLLRAIASSVAESNPAGALKWVQSLADPVEKQICLATVISSASEFDLTVAKEALTQLPPGAIRNETLGDVAWRIARMDPGGAKDWVAGLKPNEQAMVMRNVVNAVAQTDPVGAEKLAATLPPGRENDWAWRSIAFNRAIKDPAATLVWAATLDSEQARVTATAATFDNWAAHSPVEAAAALGSIHDPNLRRTATERLATNWAEHSPAEAERWASALSGEERITALSAVWNTSATDDPQRAARSLASVSAQANSDTAIDKLAHSAASIAAAWTGQNPAEAAAWAGSLPDGKVREEALGKVAADWGRYDPEGVSTWINQLPHDRSRDKAIAEMVRQIAPTDPASAFAWAASVDNKDKQVEVLTAAAKAWKAQNPESARIALENSPLPDSVKARVMDAVR